MTVRGDADLLTTGKEINNQTCAEVGLSCAGRSLNEEVAVVERAAHGPQRRLGDTLRPAVPRSVRHLPPPIAGDTYPQTPGIERRSVSTYVIARPDERFETSTGLAVRHTEQGGTAHVEMRPANGQLTDAAVSEIRKVAAQLSAVDDDVLDVLLANAIANGSDADGLHTIEIDAILDTRQRGVRHKAEGRKTYLSGRRQETRDDAVARLRRLETLSVSIGERKMRGKMVREYDRVVGIQRLITVRQRRPRCGGALSLRKMVYRVA